MSIALGKFLDLRLLEDFSRQDSCIHRFAPESKVITTAAFLVLALSLDRYAVSDLLPFFLYPILLLGLGNIPPGRILARVLPVMPFVLFIGIFNPLFDTTPMIKLGNFTLSGGWVSFTSIVLRGFLTALVTFSLISTTGFPQICGALSRMGLPSLLTTQLLLLYHSLFILGEEATRMYAAWKLRSMGKKRMPLKVWGSLIGHLLLRSLDRSGRLHLALLARGFDGELKSKRHSRFQSRDLLFIIICIASFCLLRFTSPAHLMGEYIERFFL